MFEQMYSLNPFGGNTHGVVNQGRHRVPEVTGQHASLGREGRAGRSERCARRGGGRWEWGGGSGGGGGSAKIKLKINENQTFPT